MANHKLKRVLFLQAGKCFYCRRHLNKEDATLDHIIPKSLGGLMASKILWRVVKKLINCSPIHR